jgi:hypothetical protein
LTIHAKSPGAFLQTKLTGQTETDIFFSKSDFEKMSDEERVCVSDLSELEAFDGVCTMCGMVTLPHNCGRGRIYAINRPGDDTFPLPPAKKRRDEKFNSGVDALKSMLTAYDEKEKRVEVLTSQLDTSQKTTTYYQEELAKEKATRDTYVKNATAAAEDIIFKQGALLKEKDKLLSKMDKDLASAKSRKMKAKRGIVDLYELLIERVKCAYTSKGEQRQASWTPPTAPPTPASSMTPVVMILQKNIDRQYLTVREIAWDANTNKFNFDAGSQPWAPSWKPIMDQAINTALLTLGSPSTLTSDMKSWKPIVGKTVRYTFGQHTYDVTVEMKPYPQQPQKVPYKMPWQHEVLFTGSFYQFSTQALTRYLNDFDFTALPDVKSKTVIHGVVTGGEQGKWIASLAELFSSFGQKFTYDAAKCQLWVKPPWFRVWLDAANQRGYRECRILMHGCRNGEYDKIAADPTGFDMARSHIGAKKWGFYGACSDHIASEYASYARNQDGSLMYPDGTAYMGLLLVKDNAPMGAYEHYHLGCSRPGSLADRSANDAFAVRDQCLWLPLGLAFAKLPAPTH